MSFSKKRLFMALPSVGGPASFYLAYKFDLDTDFEGLKQKVQEATNATTNWSMKEKAFVGRYFVGYQKTTQTWIRLFPDYVVELDKSFPKDDRANWETTVVQPVLTMLQSLGATNFRTDPGYK